MNATISHSLKMITDLTDTIKDDTSTESQTFGEPTDAALIKLCGVIRACGPPRARILDVGSGFGRVCFTIKATLPDTQVTGVEVSSVRHTVAARYNDSHNLGCTFIHADANEIDVCAFDVVYVYDFAFLSETRRKLAKRLGNCLLVCTKRYHTVFLQNGFIPAAPDFVMGMRGGERHVFSVLQKH